LAEGSVSEWGQRAEKLGRQSGLGLVEQWEESWWGSQRGTWWESVWAGLRESGMGSRMGWRMGGLTEFWSLHLGVWKKVKEISKEKD
jgi:hypothetical protein